MENNANSVSPAERYFSGLVKFGISEESVSLLREKFGHKIEKASIGTKKDSGCAYEGSLLDVVFKAATNARNINNFLSPSVKVDIKSLFKVCFLAMIGIAERTIPQNDMWRQDHLGEMFVYKEGNVAIPNTWHSMSMCSECGISFSPEEIEAMTIIDRSDDDKQSRYYSSLLSTIVKSAFEITFAEFKALEKKK
jgi:hypothetical protein